MEHVHYTQSKNASQSYSIIQPLGYTKYFGKQFRYVYPLCTRREWMDLQKISPFIWTQGAYPKDKDCLYKRQTGLGKHEICEKPFININGTISRLFQ